MDGRERLRQAPGGAGIRGAAAAQGLALCAAAGLWLTAGAAWAQTAQPYRGPGMMWGNGWFGWIFGPLILLLLIVAVGMLAMALVRWFAGSGRQEGGAAPPPPARTALDILKERYARGEIDTEEYQEKRRVLEQ